MFALHSANLWTPNEFSAEASSIISKHLFPNHPNNILPIDIGQDLVNFVDRPELINEVFSQIEFKWGGYSVILSVLLSFAETLKDSQIKKLNETYAGNLLLSWMASLLLNVNPDTANLNDRADKGKKFVNLYAKLQLNWKISESENQKQYIGDILPGNTGISDRFGTGHDGSHIRSPKMGGNVLTISSLKGNVIRQYVQSLPSDVTGKNTLYGVWVLLRDGKVVVYKDLLTVDTKLKKLQIGKLYLNGTTPTSKITVSTGEIIGTVQPWDSDDPTNKRDVGLHLTFIYLRYLNEYKINLGLTDEQRERRQAYSFPVEKLIAPCGEESPVKCIM